MKNKYFVTFKVVEVNLEWYRRQNLDLIQNVSRFSLKPRFIPKRLKIFVKPRFNPKRLKIFSSKVPKHQISAKTQ
jgi:hypothetical protein